MKKFLSRFFNIVRVYNPKGELYLVRYVIYGNRETGRSIYLHRFIGPDHEAHLHDHPKTFITIGLWGRYRENANTVTSLHHNRRHDGTYTNYFSAPWVRKFGTELRHKIEDVQRNTWTLVFCGKHSKHWGFYVTNEDTGKEEFVVWWEYCSTYGRPYERDS